MKKLILSIVVTAFAVAVQAGEVKTTSSKEKTAACSSVTKVSDQAKTSCCASKTACKDAPTKQALLSPKAAGEVTKKL